MARKARKSKQVAALTHGDASRKNIPTAEHQATLEEDKRKPLPVTYERNRDLDPQLMWRGKDEQDWQSLVVPASPLFIQEKVKPKVLIDDLVRRSKEDQAADEPQVDLFGDFNGLPDDNARTEFYQHDAKWSNRMILGDSLQVMASLAEREGLRGKVQCIYIDPPYGIKFNSNFQWSTTSRDVKDGKAEHMTREPEQVKAFRDTWRDGIHSYLTYLRDRLTVARDLLTESGSVFVQIGDENVHRVRALMDEVFGEDNFFSLIHYRALTPLGSRGLSNVYDYIVWYAKDKTQAKYRNVQVPRPMEDEPEFAFRDDGSGMYEKLREPPSGAAGVFKRSSLYSSGYTPTCIFDFDFRGETVRPTGRKSWRTNFEGVQRLIRANRLFNLGSSTYYRQFFSDSPMRQMENTWTDTAAGFSDTKVYVVQTHDKIVSRCILMSSDPGDLVLDPTCGSGTTAYVAEQWGRRWITIDTSRVALALARARIMGARYPYYLLADSPEGQAKEAELSGTEPSETPTHGAVRQGFIYERVPHVTLRSIANNTEIDVIYDEYQTQLELLRSAVNRALDEQWEEWQIPRGPDDAWPNKAQQLHAEWWQLRTARQQAIDASIAAKADYEHLYDKPYEDKRRVRVAGPFTVESLSPHRALPVDEDGDATEVRDRHAPYQASNGHQDYTTVILENLQAAGVQQIHKDNRITFGAPLEQCERWPGAMVCAIGRYAEGDGGDEKRAAIFVGPEFGTVSRPDLVEAAREAADAGCDVLIACAFNYDVQASEFGQLGRVPILKARMNADLHMAQDLKKTKSANLFVVFGEPDIDVLPAGDELQVKINGVDVYHPASGEVRSHETDGIACWFVDTDYNQESFFVRQAYFLGASDPYKSLKTTLKAEINPDAWATLHSSTSRPFPKPKSGRIAVKVINHLGDEVMKVVKV